MGGNGWPAIQYHEMEEVGRILSALLRDAAGDYRCDLITSVTHSRYPVSRADFPSSVGLKPPVESGSARNIYDLIDMISC